MLDKLDSISSRLVLSVLILVGLFYLPAPAFSQQASINVIENGDFESGFEDGLGVGIGWSAFNNGNASGAWGPELVPESIIAGDNSQMMQIENAIERDRYVGIYQTVNVVPGQQYRLTVKGLVRSEEGDITVSDYGYRLQYAVDLEGDASWELLDKAAWQEFPWDEQVLYPAEGSQYRQDTFNTTITATSDQMTIFIRGWKKWIDSGTGIFVLDEISLVGPSPDGVAADVEAAAIINNGGSALPVPEDAPVSAELAPVSETALQAQPPAAPAPAPAQLPVSGYGDDGSVIYIVAIGGFLLFGLFISAVVATLRQRNPIQ